jgi:chaperonin GroEL
MAKIMLHDAEAREALGRGVAKLARAVKATLGPCGMNAIIDRPIGTPMISRDGVAIASEIELEDPFENMGAQVLREVSRQTNEVAGDGTTTAVVLAEALVANGLARLAGGGNAVELVRGIELGAERVIGALRERAIPLTNDDQVRAVAVIAANDERIGDLVAEALRRVGPNGIVNVDYGATVETRLEVVDGMAFDRGYLSHHMVTDVERSQAVLDDPLILMTDLKLQSQAELDAILTVVHDAKRPLLVIAEEVSPASIVTLLGWREKAGVQVAAIHPPEYGHWRKAMLDDLGVVTGGRVIARDLGGTIEAIERRDFGRAHQVRIGSDYTTISGGGGDPKAIEARRQQVQRQIEHAPPNVERDKLEERLAKLCGGTAIIMVGAATPVEQKRRAQLIDDALNAARAAVEEGILPGGGTALAQTTSLLTGMTNAFIDGAREGIGVLQAALIQPLACISRNAGHDPDPIVAKVTALPPGTGFDARRGRFTDMVADGIIDPAKVTVCAMRNAVSVALLVLTTDTLIARKPEYVDPTAGPAVGGGAEKLGGA